MTTKASWGSWGPGGRPDEGRPRSAKLVCGDCGGWYGSKIWCSNTKHRKVVWQCNDKYKGDTKCRTTHVTEAEVKQRFLAAWNSIADNREALISDCQIARAMLCDCKDVDKELAEINREVDVVTRLSRKAIHVIAHSAAEEKKLSTRNNGYLERHRKATERIAALEEAKRRRKSRARILETFIRNIVSSPQVLTEFDEKLWAAAIDRVTVRLDDRLVFRFKDGTEVLG